MSESEDKFAIAMRRLHELDSQWDDDELDEMIAGLNNLIPEFRLLGGEQNVLSRRGQCYYDLNKYDEASKDFERAAELGLENAGGVADFFVSQCLRYLGCSYQKASNWEAALGVWNRLEEIYSTGDVENPEFGPHELAEERARTMQKLDRHEPVVELLRELLFKYDEIDVTTARKYEVVTVLTNSLRALGRHDDALAVLERLDISKLDDTDVPQFLLQKCMILESLKSKEELLDTAIHLDSIDSEMYNPYARYYLGIAKYWLGDVWGSIQLLEEVVELAATNGWLHQNARHLVSQIKALN